MTHIISLHWHKRNVRQKSNCINELQNSKSPLLNVFSTASG
jgi:hypothetical protein